jgi:membrane-associated phospholipid phosphatase
VTRDRDLRWLLPVALAYAVATAAAIVWLDGPLAHWLATFEKPAWAGTVITYLEYAAGIEPWKWTLHVVLVGGTLIALLFARAHFGRVAFIAMVALLSRNLMLWCKGATGRLRPSEWSGGPTFFEHGISFPSGHVVIFAGLAIPIALAYPRAWPVLLVVPAAMIARLAVDAHFASDVLGGVALVALCAWLCGPLLRR